MRLEPFPRIGIVSHILPPSPSGQAMVLFRLLSSLSEDKYLLISRENYEGAEYGGEISAKLPGKYYHLMSRFRLPQLNLFILDYISIAINALIGIYNRAKQITKIVKEEDIDVLLACTGDPYDLPAAYLASKWTNIPFVPYMFDDYAYQWTGGYRSISRRLEPIVLRNAKCVIVPNEYMQKEYDQRYSVRSTVIHNSCHLPNLEDLDKAEKIFRLREVNIIYAGAIYHAHYDAFRNLIEAIARLERNDVKVHIYTAQPESELKQNGISGPAVIYHSHINESEVPKVLRQADILFLPLAFNSPIPEVIKTSAPGKMGEYLAVGRPVIVHAPRDSFVSWFFRKNNCGVVVDKNDPIILAKEINQLISKPETQRTISRHARKMAEKEFNVDIMRSKFDKFIRTQMQG